MEFQLSYFRSWKLMLLKVPNSTCQKIWKTQQWPKDWKRSFFIPNHSIAQRKAMPSSVQWHLMAESEEELKSLLMKVKEESEKVGLKLSIQKAKIMASGPIIAWQTDREKMEIMTGFIFLSFKITTDGYFSHEIKRLLLLERKTMTNLDSILKSRDHTLPTKVWQSELCFFQ